MNELVDAELTVLGVGPIYCASLKSLALSLRSKGGKLSFAAKANYVCRAARADTCLFPATNVSSFVVR